LHGHVERLPAFAGYLERIRSLRAANGGVVLVDAGDLFQGTLESNLNEGAAVIAGMNWLGYSAAALGNHDFDYGPAGDVEPSTDRAVDRRGALKARLREARFPLLAANLSESGGPPRWDNLSLEPVLLDVAGVKVGIIGGLTEETPAIVMRAYFEGLDVGPLAPALAAQARRARQLGARIVVAAVHAGGKCTQLENPHDTSSCDPTQEIARVAGALEPSLVDVIVAGHTHKGVAHFLSGIPVVEGWALGTAFSRVDVSVPPDPGTPLKVSVFPPQQICQSPIGSCVPGEYEGARVQASSKLDALMAPYREKARALRDEKLGVDVTAPVRQAHDRESALGNLLADLLVEATPGADVGIVNGGGLRAPLDVGPLTYGGLYEAQPFDNRVALLRMTGQQLISVLRAHLGHSNHGIVSLGGARLEVRCGNGKLDVQLVRTNGKRIAEAENLIVVTSDYLATGGDELFVPLHLPPEALEIRAQTVRDAVAAQLRRRKTPLSGDDTALLDPKKPRLGTPMPRPVTCVSARSSR